jgi:DNA/RNA-binding domain of Phe-tRNA-synthetase-like protein
VGAFDADQVKFPTVLRYAGEGDETLLLGDKEPTRYTAKEIAYYDQIGGYNIDFNFRDAQRTKVTENTKNLWINVDGVFDITLKQVEQSLNESVKLIIKYCGGTCEFSGVIR